MARSPAPWNWQDPVVDAKGKATPEFLAWLSQQLTVNTLATGAVPQSREINTGLGLTGGGDLTTDRTISLDAVIDDLNDVDTVTNPPVDGQALIWDNVAGDWVPGDAAPPLTVEEEDVTVATEVSTLNFTGAGVTVTDAGSGQVDIDISGAVGDPAWQVFATGTGASQVVAIPNSGLTDQEILVFVNGIRYETDEYVVSGTNVTLTTNAAGDSIEIVGALTGGGGGSGTGVAAGATFYWTGAAVVILKSSNVTSITRAGAGRYIFTFTTAMADTYYQIAVKGKFSPFADNNYMDGGMYRNGSALSTTNCEVIITEHSNLSAIDPGASTPVTVTFWEY